MCTVTATEVRRPGRRPSLSREQIAQAALAIVDAEGLSGLSMQRLAGQLGVGTMTLYGYFRGKDELLDAVVDAAVSEPRRVPRGRSWRDELQSLVLSVHRTLGEHPALVEIRLRRPVVRPEALRFGERGLAILIGAGLPPKDAVAAFRLLFTYVFGHAALSAERNAAEAREQTRRAVAGLPKDRFPQLSTHADAFSDAVAGDAQFGLGLELILDGIAQRVRGERR